MMFRIMSVRVYFVRFLATQSPTLIVYSTNCDICFFKHSYNVRADFQRHRIPSGVGSTIDLQRIVSSVLKPWAGNNYDGEGDSCVPTTAV